MTSNNSPILNIESQYFNNNLNNNQNEQMPNIKRYWCHLCKKDFFHQYENDDIKCLFCGKTFCEIIENEDTTSASHPIHFEPFILNNTNAQSNINNSSNINEENIRNNLNHFNRRTEFLRSRATQIVEFLNNFVFIRNNRNNDNIDNIISHIMLHDPNKYGNPPAAKKAVENLKKYKITKEKIKEFGFENSCAVCKDEFIIDEECLSMPCNHNFHKDCIIPWLKERNSCPICRYELPTDDKDFEERKKLKLKTENSNNSINNENFMEHNDNS